MNLRPTVTLLALGTVLLTGCGTAATDPASGQDQVVTPPSATATASATVAPSVAASPTAPAVRVISVAYTGGDVETADARVETSLGEQVVLRISSDVAEEVHVHGYDVYADIPAGGSVDIPLTLTLPGSYEVELHGVGRPLFQLRTS